MQLHSFWWLAIKRSFKTAWEPFESFGKICGLIAGMVAVGFITHSITQEWGDYMIYWTVAVPVVVWWVWFFWNLIKVPHQIHQETQASLNSDTIPSSSAKSQGQSFAGFIATLIIVVAFMGLFAAKNWQIAQLKKQLNPSKQVTIKPKPLPETIIPAPAPPINQVPEIAAKTATNVEPQVQFETNNPNTDDAESEFKKLKAEKLAQAEASNQALKLNIQSQWKTNLTLFNYAIEALHDILNKEAQKRGDTIAKTAGYFQCLPQDIGYDAGRTNIAEIRLTTMTNLDFHIGFGSRNNYQYKLLFIECDCGKMEIEPTQRSGPENIIIRASTPEYLDNKLTSAADARAIIMKHLKALVGEQIEFHKKT